MALGIVRDGHNGQKQDCGQASLNIPYFLC